MTLIETLFTDTVTILPFVRYGAGEAMYGEAEERRCRLETGKALSSGKSASGVVDVEPSMATMYCVGEPIPVNSIVQCKNRDYMVTECLVLNGFIGSHLEVTMQ